MSALMVKSKRLSFQGRNQTVYIVVLSIYRLIKIANKKSVFIQFKGGADKKMSAVTF